MSRRQLVLGLALLLSLAWSAWTLTAPDADDGVALAVRPLAGKAERIGPSIASAAGNLTLPQRPQAPGKVKNLFGEYSYRPPAPPTPVAVAEAAHAPALPFVFTGRLIIDGETTYLLLQGAAPVQIKVGAAVSDFRLVEAAPERLVFVHEPTGERVAMSIASTAIN